MAKLETAVVLAIVLIVAGCSAPVSQIDTTETHDEPTTRDAASVTIQKPQSKYRVRTVGGRLPFDANATYARTQALLGTDVRPPVVVIKSPAKPSNESRYSPVGDFGHVLGIEPTIDVPSEWNASGFTASERRVEVWFTDETPPGIVERILVHEFVHAIQQRTDGDEALSQAGWRNYTGTVDSLIASRSVFEGAAVSVADRYVETHLNETPTESAVLREQYPQVSPATRLFWAPYYFGSRYVDDRTDSMRNLTAVYERAPWTTEQVIHGYAPDEEVPRPLSVEIEDGRDWHSVDTSTRGELYLRIVLSGRLDESRAARSAAGWGNDELVTFRAENATGYAWVVRWDARDDADGFESALSAFLERRDEQSDRTRRDDAEFRVVRPGNRTVVLFAGHQEFVRNATAAGSGSDVKISVGS